MKPNKFMFIGDVHWRSKNPINRSGSYMEDMKLKWQSIFNIAKAEEVSYILCTGDVFDNPTMALSTIVAAYETFKSSPCEIVVVPGNHDIFGYNLESWESSSLYLLHLLLPGVLNVVYNPKEGLDLNRIFATGQGYTNYLDEDGETGYTPLDSAKNQRPLDPIKVHIVHSMLMDHEVPFKHTVINDVVTTADIILSGHDHVGYGVKHRADGVTFVNPGSIMRSSISEAGREPKVVLFDTDTFKQNKVDAFKVIKLPCVKDVFNVERYEELKNEKEALIDFSTLLHELRERKAINPKDLVMTFAKVKEVSEEVMTVVQSAIKSAEEAKIIGR